MIKLIVIVFSGLAFAAPVEIYRFGKMSVAFTNIDGYVVNKSCDNCEALRKAKEFKGKYPDSSLLLGGKNPSAVKCKSLLGGKVIIGTDRMGNEQSFCAFSDDSFLR